MKRIDFTRDQFDCATQAYALNEDSDTIVLAVNQASGHLASHSIGGED